MFLWLFLARPLFSQSSSSATINTNLAHGGKVTVLVCAMVSKLHLTLYTCTCMGCYNLELSARYSFGALYSRGCCIQGGVIIQRLRYVQIATTVRT